ncbi:uncharacterized protein [Dysidea avara]|uniref:uncharacterized protein n=1 Tax=Dysidea avara TaxID=196820 RepID=UPI003332C67A
MISVLLLVTFVTITAAQYTPIPPHPPGFTYKASGYMATPVIELFYDHLCPGSKGSWPTMKQVFDSNENITGIIHIFPLPYHHNAYFVTLAGVVIRNLDQSLFVQFMEAVFNDQDKFLTQAENMTEPEVQKMIAEFVALNLKGISSQSIMDGFTDDKVVTVADRAWEYGCSRGVSGTPFFMINGVLDHNAGSYSVSDWTKMINKLKMGP